ncbi:MAG: hypothetical protein AAFO77_01010 [Pseudomonadota bacterium]
MNVTAKTNVSLLVSALRKIATAKADTAAAERVSLHANQQGHHDADK